MGFSITKNHILAHDSIVVNDLTLQTAEKNSQKFKDGNLDTVIMHYTAGRDAASSAKYLVKPEVKASAHLVIGREGEIYQLVPFDTIAWHAGKSSYSGRVGFNSYSIGIEMDNAGILKNIGTEYQAWFGKNYPASEVIQATHRNEETPNYWHTYTENQLEIVKFITEVLVSQYSIKQILGHEEISPGRKQDPGPAFDLDKFRNNILGEDRGSDDAPSMTKGKVSVDKLNIRQGPGSKFDKVAAPLKNGQNVKILEEENGWYKVETTITGWVSKGYIKP